jgi:hypothetical protein
LKDGAQVSMGFTPVTAVHPRRQNHQPIHAHSVCLFRKPNRFSSTESGDAGNYWRSTVQRPPGPIQELKFLFPGKRRRFPERSQSNNAAATTFDQPASLGSKGFVVDGQISLEWGRDGWEYSSPIFLVQSFILLLAS